MFKKNFIDEYFKLQFLGNNFFKTLFFKLSIKKNYLSLQDYLQFQRYLLRFGTGHQMPVNAGHEKVQPIIQPGIKCLHACYNEFKYKQVQRSFSEALIEC